MRSLKIFFFTFPLAFFCLSLIIMATVLWVHPYSRQPDNRTLQHISVPQEEDGLSILIVHQQEKLRSAVLLSFLPTEGYVLLKTFPPDLMVNGENLASVWSKGKESAVKEQLNLTSDRYIVVDDQQFEKFIDLLGTVPIQLNEPLIYTEADMTISLGRGLQHLDGEQILHYLSEIEKKDDYTQQFSLLLQSICERALILLSKENSQNLYYEMLDCMDSDLSINDYDLCHSSLAFLMQIVKNPVKLA